MDDLILHCNACTKNSFLFVFLQLFCKVENFALACMNSLLLFVHFRALEELLVQRILCLFFFRIYKASLDFRK